MIFLKILVPVDFTINTQIAIKKAIELSGADSPTIFLLHVMHPVSKHSQPVTAEYDAFTKSDRYQREITRLQKLRLDIFENMSTNAKVETLLVAGKIEEAIVEKAKDLNIDLIILGKHNRQIVFPVVNAASPNKIARLSNCPVLTVKAGSIDRKIKSIVVPVGQKVPKRKIEIVVALANKFHAKIHLVTLKKANVNHDRNASQAVLRTFEILQNFSQNSSIEHKVLEGNNLASAALKYSETIAADLILVNPDTETRISNFTGQHITDRILNSSPLQVLQLEPYQIRDMSN
jgi:nucleotide-binding universal stress UspA family protein